MFRARERRTLLYHSAARKLAAAAAGLLLLTILLSGGAAQASAAELIYSQPFDNYTTFYSYQTPDGATDYEAADDFYVIGNIERVVAYGYGSLSASQVQRAIVSFYEFGADGKPGALQARYMVDPGPNLVVGFSGINWIDVTLPSPFSATGKHFLSVQPVISTGWSWWNSSFGKPRGQAVYTRTAGGVWGHPVSVVGGTYPSDLNFSLYGIVTGPGRIDSLSETSLPRSGYLEILGGNFGGSGSALVDGIAAPIAAWTDSKIVAYVPEAARTGTVPVQVVTAGGAGNSVNLDVTARQPSGRLNWRFRMNGPYSIVRPAIAPDGTVYSIDVFSHLYSLSPDGGLKWLVRGAGNKGVAVGQDGTVYVGSEATIKAFYPNGTLKWNFVQNPRAFILLGLSMGPDGNIYAVGTQGMGVFSLTPSGQLRWATPEPYSRPIVDYGEIVFGANGSRQQLYFYANNHVRALRIEDGASVFSLYGGTQPAIGPDGSVHTAGAAYTPNGTLIWSFPFPAPINTLSPADVGSDGNHYVVQNLIEVWGLNSGGGQRFHVTLPSSVQGPIMDPTNTQLLLGSMNTLDHAAFVQSVGAANGKINWTHTFPAEPGYNASLGMEGFNQWVATRARFTADGQTAFVVTATASGDNYTSRSFVNSINTGSASPPPPPPPTAVKLRSTDISLSAKEQRRGTVTVSGLVTVRDELGAAVSGVTASVTWTLPGGATQAQVATTDTSGVARFGVKSGRGTYTLTLTNLAKVGYTFDAANSVLSKSITK